MDLFIYSDESGVFDYKHNDYFVFGGLVCFGKEEKDLNARKYSHVEKVLRNSLGVSKEKEIKASLVKNADKGKLFRSLNRTFKFCVVIKQKRLKPEIYESKKHKQRYLDYAYKMCLKRLLQMLIQKDLLDSKTIDSIHVYVDEHTTATDGLYELRENLLNEFKYGTFNGSWGKYFEPIFPLLKGLDVHFCDSKNVLLVRAADIVANHCYHNIISNNGMFKKEPCTFVYMLPENRIAQDGCDYYDNNDSQK